MLVDPEKLVLSRVLRWEKGTITMAEALSDSTTLQRLEQDFADIGKLRPVFIVTGNGAGNHPHAINAGDIALTAANMARRARSQEGWSNVQVKRWSPVGGKYVLDLKTQEQAFPTQPANDSNQNDKINLVERRRMKGALQTLALVVDKARKEEAFDADSRAYLVGQFLTAYTAIGGNVAELIDNIEQA